MKAKYFFKPTKAEIIYPYPTDPTKNVKRSPSYTMEC